MLGVHVRSDSFNRLPEPSPVRAGTEGQGLVPAIGDTGFPNPLAVRQLRRKRAADFGPTAQITTPHQAGKQGRLGNVSLLS